MQVQLPFARSAFKAGKATIDRDIHDYVSDFEGAMSGRLGASVAVHQVIQHGSTDGTACAPFPRDCRLSAQRVRITTSKLKFNTVLS